MAQSAAAMAIVDDIEAREQRCQAIAATVASVLNGGPETRILRGAFRKLRGLELAVKSALEGGRLTSAKLALLEQAGQLCAEHGVDDVDVADLPEREPDRIVPRRVDCGEGWEGIFSGNSRPGWTIDISELGAQACVLCSSTNNLSIDHKVPWSSIIIGCETVTVCCNGHHWDCVLSSVAGAASNHLPNLRILCQPCNSSKGGVKGNDFCGPRYLGRCPGDCGEYQGKR